MPSNSADIWVCASCRSVNKARAKQCYNCRTPRDLAAVDPTQMEVTGHGQVRAVALPPFRSSRGRALLASVLILAVAVLQVVSTVVGSNLINGILDGGSVTDPDIRMIGNISIAGLAIALLALVAWAFWLSRVVTEMPALGLGYPAATGMTAFVENFIPFFNLIRVPAIVRDVVRRVDPMPGVGEALISAAFFGIFAGFVIPRVGGILSGLGASTLVDAYRRALVVEAVATGIVFVGAVFLVVLIWWIEIRITRRRAEQLAEAPVDASAVSPTPAPAAIAEAPRPVESATVPAPGTVVGATALGASPLLSGPRLHVIVTASGITAGVDGSTPEPVTVEELHGAAPALATAGGTAQVVTSDADPSSTATAEAITASLRAAGIPTN
jgi:hypothetical protein